MKKFIVTYHAPADFMAQSKNVPPEEMKKGMEAWMVWAKKCGAGLVDMGSPLSGGEKVSKSGSTPSQREVVGYSVLQADDLSGAKKLLEGHPHLEWADSCEIEVHESMPMPQ